MSEYRKHANITLKLAEGALQTATLLHEYQTLHVLRRLEANGITLRKDVTQLEDMLLDNLAVEQQVERVKQPYLLLFKRDAYTLAPEGHKYLRTERESLKQRIAAREENTKDLGLRLLILGGDFDKIQPQWSREYAKYSKQSITQRIEARRKSKRGNRSADSDPIVDDIFDIWLFSSITDPSTPSGFGSRGGSFGGGGASALYDDAPSIPHIDPAMPTVGYAVGEKIAETASVATESAGGVLDNLGDLASDAGETIGNITSGTVEVLGDLANGAAEIVGEVLSNLGD